VTLGFDIRALSLVGKCSRATHPAFLLWLFFKIGPHIYAWASLDPRRPIYAPHVTGVTGTCHNAQFLIG
jgi:hypothetical protein